MPFDPDEYLAQAPPPATPPPAGGFDPDAYLAGGAPPPPVDKYQAAAIAERDRLKAAGVSLPEGYTRRVMSGPLLGWGDEAAAAMTTPLEMLRHHTWDPREGYAYGKAREDLAGKAAAERTGMLGDVAEIGGGLALLPGNIFARQASAALGGGTAARVAGYGAEGATLGGIQGAGSAETVGDIPRSAGWGATLGGAFAAPFGAFANVARRSSAAVPSEAELEALGSRDYRARDRAPVSYSAQRVADKLDALQQATQFKYGRLDVPETHRTIGQLSDMARDDIARAAQANAAQGAAAPGSVVPPGGYSGAPNPWQATLSPREIASFRRVIYEGGAKGSPTDERAGTIASKIMDRVLSRPDPADLARGTPQDAAAVAALDTRGRGNFGAGYRSQAITEQVNKSLEQAAGQHSGLNFENILRQNLRQARAKEAFGGFNPAEEAGAEQLIHQTAKANARREFGNMLGGGGGLGRVMAMGTGGGVGGGLTAYAYGGDPLMGAAAGAGLGLTGRALRTSGNAAAQRGAEQFAEQLRMRSPEYTSRVAVAPTEIGPGLTSSFARGALKLPTADEGAVRDAIAAALQYQVTGQRPLPRVVIDTPRKDEEQP